MNTRILMLCAGLAGAVLLSAPAHADGWKHERGWKHGHGSKHGHRWHHGHPHAQGPQARHWHHGHAWAPRYAYGYSPVVVLPPPAVVYAPPARILHPRPIVDPGVSVHIGIGF